MKNKIYYIASITISIIGILIIPNLLLKKLWLNETIAPVATMAFNMVILPVLLLIIVSIINEIFDKDFWIMNYFLMAGAVLISIYLGYLNWANLAGKTPVGWGRDNLDKGTYMILNLERMIGLGILSIAFIIKLIQKNGSLKEKESIRSV